MKAKITNEHLEKLEIVNKLRMQNGILNTERPVDIDVLASRIVCRPDLLTEVLESLDVEIIE